MAYFIDLFSPETYDAFARSPRDISGFRVRHKNIAEKIKPGDVFVCYLTRLSRWFGLLEVIKGPFIDNTPVFVQENDPFVVRFRVRPKVWLDIDKGIPIHDDAAKLNDGRTPLEHALHDGEDHELLFTSPTAHDAYRHIGRMTESRDIMLEQNGSRVPLEPKGWEHTL